MARILMVDDDQDILLLCAALLQRSGHEVLTAVSALQGLELLKTTKVDLLITDANMPEHNGFDLLRTLKMDPEFSHDMAIVMLTGRRERKDIERAVTFGAHEYIVKPLEPELFLQKITDLLNRRSSSESASSEMTKIKVNAEARAVFEVKIDSVSETGLVIRSDFQFPEGVKFKFQTQLLSEIGIEYTEFRVLSSTEREDHWESSVAFVGVGERVLAKVRAWIDRQSQKKAV